MADVFSMKDARTLLKDKFMLMIGDSNTRAIYKDLLYLLHKGGIAPEIILRKGSEITPQCREEILDTATTKMGRSYYEVRQCQEQDLWVRFVFVTQAAAPSLQRELKRLEEGALPPPEIVVLNSCLWDLTRWGPQQEDQYKENVAKLFHRLKCLLPPTSMVVWTASMPVATERVKGGVFIKQIEFIKHSMRFMLLEANLFVRNLCSVFGFGFLDLHYYMQYQLNRRTNDGLHWEPPAIRYINCILLTHIAISLNKPLPGNVAKDFLLQNHKNIREESLEEEGKNVSLDSKIVKYLKNLGMEVHCLSDQTPPSEEKEERPQKRVKRQARRPGKDGRGDNKKSNKQPVPDKIQPLMPELGCVGPPGQCIPSWGRKTPGDGLMGSYQEGTAPGQYFTNCGSSGLVQGLQPEIGIEPLFSNMAVGWPPQSCNQHRMSMMPPQRLCHQPDTQQFNFHPNEFWQDYPVNNFPWNYHH